MRAEPGGKDYGALSVAVQYYAKPSAVMEVPPCSFIPQPDVDSTVVKLDIYDNPPVDLHDRELFFRVVKAAFGQRRKTLLNAINNAGYFNLDKEEIKKILERTGLDENQRGETLSITQFALLSNLIYDKLKPV
jgi:16S rRNA (adenine1518-N6/adenine1519-N6)-dimethyltransferase